MRAIWYDEQGPAGDVLTLGETAEPAPGPGEVAVYVKASGVNPSDVKQRAGARGPMSVARQIPHSDGAGVIKAVGEGVDPSRIGERVWLYNAAFKRSGGTCAEVCVLPAEFAAPLDYARRAHAGALLWFSEAAHTLVVRKRRDDERAADSEVLRRMMEKVRAWKGEVEEMDVVDVT